MVPFLLTEKTHPQMCQIVKKAVLSAAVIRRLQDSHRIDRLCRSGEAFSVVKCNFTEENIHQHFSKKWLCHFFDTLTHPQDVYEYMQKLSFPYHYETEYDRWECAFLRDTD